MKKLWLLLLSFAVAVGVAYAGDTMFSGVKIEGDKDPAGSATTKILTVTDTSGSETVSVDGAGDVAFSETGGSTSDPDLSIAGYTKLTGDAEFSDSTLSLSSSPAANFGTVEVITVDLSGPANTTGTNILTAFTLDADTLTSSNATNTLFGIHLPTIPTAGVNWTETGVFIGLNWDVAIDVDSGDVDLTGANAFVPPVTTVAGLSATAPAGSIATVTDANSPTDCSTGSGSLVNTCVNHGDAETANWTNLSALYDLLKWDQISAIAKVSKLNAVDRS